MGLAEKTSFNSWRYYSPPLCGYIKMPWYNDRCGDGRSTVRVNLLFWVEYGRCDFLLARGFFWFYFHVVFFVEVWTHFDLERKTLRIFLKRTKQSKMIIVFLHTFRTALKTQGHCCRKSEAMELENYLKTKGILMLEVDWTMIVGGKVIVIPSRELTYPPKMAFWRWFSLSRGEIC